MKTSLAWAFVLLAAAVPPTLGMDVVKNGNPVACVVTPEEPDLVTAAAAAASMVVVVPRPASSCRAREAASRKRTPMTNSTTRPMITKSVT